MNTMLLNLFKSTLRHISKARGFSILNILGLAIGIACAGLIFLWVEDELHFDTNHLKKDRLFLVKTNNKVDKGVFTHSSTAGPLAEALRTTMPGIANTCRTTEGETSALFTSGTQSVNATGKYAEPSLFMMFSLPFAEGNATIAFKQLHSIVLTEKAALKIFGTDHDLLGKSVRMDYKQDYVVTGVLKDIPENSSLQFEWLAPFQVWFDENGWAKNWSNFGLSTYIELKPGVDVGRMNETLTDPYYDFTSQKKERETSSVHAFLFGMNDWRLRNDFDNGRLTGNGRIQYVHLFTVIAWIILFIACINFMNLATASSERRAKEIGVRKVLGAGRNSLVIQFMGEAVFMTFLAAALAVGLIMLCLPAFNELVAKNLVMGITSPTHLTALVSIAGICGLLAGIYPALYLSAFNPVFVLKGIKIKTGAASVIRQGLVVVQFAVSIVLIIGTLIIYQQIQHVKGRDIGYNKNNLVQIDAQGEMVKNFPAIKTDLLNTGFVVNAALADHATITGGNNTTSIRWPGKDPNSMVVISQRLVSTEFMSTIGMHVIEGRDFQSTDATVFDKNHMPIDSTHDMNVIITESMARLMGKGSAIGKKMLTGRPSGDMHMQVCGVVKDYVYGDMYGESAPVVFYYIPDAARTMYVRTVAGGDLEKGLQKMAEVMKKDIPGYPFEYKFVDEQFNNLFLSETLISKLSRVFSGLAIFISCLGLFGLAAHTAERRTKEIGVRKVLGASVTGIAALLSGDFIKLVIVSCIIAVPVAWWMMSNWLQNYQYRIAISWWVFLAADVLAIGIALLTISFQAIKAARANPVDSLRSE